MPVNSKYPNLLSPIQVGPKVYKHRIVAAPIYMGAFAIGEAEGPRKRVNEAF